MKKTIGIIALTILSLVIGLAGAGGLIGLGESLNNGLYAFLIVSIPLGLVGLFFGWLAPDARWPVGIALSAPLVILSLMGAWSGGYFIIGAIWIPLCAIGGAFLGARLRRRRSKA